MDEWECPQPVSEQEFVAWLQEQLTLLGAHT